MRVLDRSADIETKFGGGFVQSIDDIEGASGGRRSDWFFFVNGIESSVGAAQYKPGDGDRIWWDYRDWTSALRTPALVGAWPEPFVHGFDGERWATAVGCFTARPVCDRVESALEAEGVDLERQASEEDTIDVLVGEWGAIRSEPDADLLAEPPDRSGVFASFAGEPRTRLRLVDPYADAQAEAGASAGLVAAVRSGDDAPTWLVTGTDAAGVEQASRLVGDPLRDHYALAVVDGEQIPVPTGDSG
jgi:hypothetical protein